MTFDLWKMEPGGAVGGRFNRMREANGTSDARRNTDGKSIKGSSSTLPSSSWNDTDTRKSNQELLTYQGQSTVSHCCRIKWSLPDFPSLRNGGFCLSFAVGSTFAGISSFSESLAPGLSNDTSVTISLTFMADLALGGIIGFIAFDSLEQRAVNDCTCDESVLNDLWSTVLWYDWFAIISMLMVSTISIGAIFFRRIRFLLLALLAFCFLFGQSLGKLGWIGADMARVKRGRISLSEALFRRNNARRVSAVLGLFILGVPLNLLMLLVLLHGIACWRKSKRFLCVY